jgi:isopentenyl phosphate kinase
MCSQISETSNLQFLKLGGSLITDKTRSHTARMDVITRLAEEIARAYKKNPKLRLVLGHGSGSFGHMPAKKFGTRLGVSTGAEWRGFVEVWREAAALNHIVLEALDSAGLPAVAFPPSASVIASNGEVTVWDLEPIQAALKSNLLPVVYGDVVFDRVLGGTILSTEDLFGYLAPQLDPGCILLAGLEPGVWADYPICTRLIPSH